MPLPNETISLVEVDDFILDPSDINGSQPNKALIEIHQNCQAIADAVVKTIITGQTILDDQTVSLSHIPFNEHSLDVFLNGFLCREDREYTVDSSGSPWTITWIGDIARIEADDELTIRIVGTPVA